MDRFLRGLIAGVIGGIAMNFFSFMSGIFGFTDLRMVDWASIIIYGHTPPFNQGEIIFGTMSHLIFTGFLGVVFSYLVTVIRSKNIIIKGWIYSSVIWFFIYAVTTFFRVEGTVPIALSTAISNAVSSSIYGITLGYFTKYLMIFSIDVDEIKGGKLVPAMKPAPNEADHDKKSND